MKLLFLILLMSTSIVGLITLKRHGSHSIAISYKWTGTFPSVSTAHGRGWAFSHNGSVQSVDEMALSMGEDIQAAHPGEYKKGKP